MLVETIVCPHGFVTAAHVPPFQTERFEILEGLLGLKLDGSELVAEPGEVVTVPPATPYRFWNTGEIEARFLTEVRPALQFEPLIETMFTLAAEGKTNSKGLPNPLRLAVIAKAHFNIVRLPSPPAVLQRAALAVGAPLGQLLGLPTDDCGGHAPARGAHPHTQPNRTYDRGRPHEPASARAEGLRG